MKIFCEPQLGKRQLYPNLSKKNNTDKQVNKMMDLMTWSDGKNSLLEIAEIIDFPIWELEEVLKKLKKYDLIEFV